MFSFSRGRAAWICRKRWRAVTKLLCCAVPSFAHTSRCILFAKRKRSLFIQGDTCYEQIRKGENWGLRNTSSLRTLRRQPEERG